MFKTRVHPSSHRNQRPAQVETSDESDKALRSTLIDSYVNLQRIQSAPDRDREIAYQMQIVQTKLALFGVDAEVLKIQ